MKNNIILNFSDVYSEENFYEGKDFEWIDCKDIAGANCFCDNEASLEIQKRISNWPAKGIHYIDSGNYHYLSKFFTDKIKEDFILVVFDHHPDMQPSAFDDILTCGGWVKTSIDTNPYLKKVILVGTSEQLLQNIDSKYSTRFIHYKGSQSLYFDLPIYISIDKDVMSKDEVDTNWDQGSMTFEELKQNIENLFYHNKVLGVDVCGECSYTKGLINPSINKNNEINRQLLILLEKNGKF